MIALPCKVDKVFLIHKNKIMARCPLNTSSVETFIYLKWSMDSFTPQVVLSFSRVELVIVLTAISVIIAPLYVLVSRGDEEHAIDFTLPLPEQFNEPLKGAVLERPTIKVVWKPIVISIKPFQTWLYMR